MPRKRIGNFDAGGYYVGGDIDRLGSHIMDFENNWLTNAELKFKFSVAEEGHDEDQIDIIRRSLRARGVRV